MIQISCMFQRVRNGCFEGEDSQFGDFGFGMYGVEQIKGDGVVFFFGLEGGIIDFWGLIQGL